MVFGILGLSMNSIYKGLSVACLVVVDLCCSFILLDVAQIYFCCLYFSWFHLVCSIHYIKHVLSSSSCREIVFRKCELQIVINLLWELR